MQRALLLLGACGLLASASIVPIQRRDDGCGIMQDKGYNNDLKIHQVGMDRNYTIWVPEDYDPDHQYPLIVDFHGAKGTADGQHYNSEYHLNPTGKEYLVVYPNGKVDEDGSHQAWGGAPYTKTTPEEDLQFTETLVQHIKDQYCVDANRIYASGKSNGGGFVDILACSPQGDKFAAFAMAAPALYTDYDTSTNCSRRRAILEAHGDQDHTICYNGKSDEVCKDKRGNLPHIDEWVSRWGKRTCGDSAQPESPTPDAPPNFSATAYSCEGYKDIVKHYHGSKMAHCWPSASGSNTDAMNENKKPLCDDRSMNFTKHVVEFFEVWSLDTVPSPDW